MITEPGAAFRDLNSFPTRRSSDLGTTGSATVSVTGGTAGYTYSWNTTPVQTSAMASGLSAGNYTATVDGKRTRLNSSNRRITYAVAGLSKSINNPTEVNCFGGTTG